MPGWPVPVITGLAVVRSVGESGLAGGGPTTPGSTEGGPIVKDGEGPLHRAGAPKEPTTATEITASNKTRIELPDQAVVRTRRSLRPESSTNTGGFVGPSFGVGTNEPVRLPCHLTRLSRSGRRSAAPQPAVGMPSSLRCPQLPSGLCTDDRGTKVTGGRMAGLQDPNHREQCKAQHRPRGAYQPVAASRIGPRSPKWWAAGLAPAALIAPASQPPHLRHAIGRRSRDPRVSVRDGVEPGRSTPWRPRIEPSISGTARAQKHPMSGRH